MFSRIGLSCGSRRNAFHMTRIASDTRRVAARTTPRLARAPCIVGEILSRVRVLGCGFLKRPLLLQFVRPAETRCLRQRIAG